MPLQQGGEENLRYFLSQQRNELYIMNKTPAVAFPDFFFLLLLEVFEKNPGSDFKAVGGFVTSETGRQTWRLC